MPTPVEGFPTMMPSSPSKCLSSWATHVKAWVLGSDVDGVSSVEAARGDDQSNFLFNNMQEQDWGWSCDYGLPKGILTYDFLVRSNIAKVGITITLTRRLWSELPEALVNDVIEWYLIQIGGYVINEIWPEYSCIHISSRDTLIRPDKVSSAKHFKGNWKYFDFEVWTLEKDLKPFRRRRRWLAVFYSWCFTIWGSCEKLPVKTAWL